MIVKVIGFFVCLDFFVFIKSYWVFYGFFIFRFLCICMFYMMFIIKVYDFFFIILIVIFDIVILIFFNDKLYRMIIVLNFGIVLIDFFIVFLFLI